ncbi:MAG: twin-arginine translocase subunit TatC [Oligoflexia bacterium]|nr:twin-arginine translocase subunit TatC [Oligoflexia bacterium]
MNQPALNKTSAAPSAEMTLFEHLAELRSCLLHIALAVLVTAIIAYYFSTQVFQILSAPYFAAFPNAPLVGTGPAEAFMIKLKVALAVGIFASSPIVFFEIWRFIAPGLYEHEKKMVLPFVVSATSLFLLGAWFCYAGVIPVAFDFFHQEYQSVGLTPNIKISEHLAMVLQGMLAFGLVFELPVLAYFGGRFGILTKAGLISSVRYAIVVIFIVSAILTPPDVLSQLLMAIPLCLLYAISIWVVAFAERKRSSLVQAAAAGPTQVKSQSSENR